MPTHEECYRGELEDRSQRLYNLMKKRGCQVCGALSTMFCIDPDGKRLPQYHTERNLRMEQWPKDNWKNLVKVTLPSGNHAVYSKPAEWMTAEEVRRYGLHIATFLEDECGAYWRLLDRLDNSMPRAATPDAVMFDDLALMEETVHIGTRHEANAWIEGEWMGKTVRQVRGSADCIGRTGVVVETMWDEKGALHCSTGEWWCPASLLEIQS